ncbi:CLUMA_CG004365, isoform A [Clunio marinus]|uniref:CLUMA_CG004365, isoform A n=1 Tax=Clunio marinus TaxID=568069 RepID=A0A1J1HRG2_9DIPT|nr:CLUMA_CG004365, isoform A [Clunio marinus]
MPSFTKRQWLTLTIMALTDFCNAICVSLQAPFFPHEAEKKGANATEYGLVFGIFELVVFVISPVYGHYMNRIGPKNLFNCGILTTGISAILFGFLDRVPGHTLFITLAFVIRIIEALGNAAFLTSSFAIIAKEFPDSVGTTFAMLETFFGLGLIVGPMVGGVLYQVDGYYLPFVVLGSSLFTCAILTYLVLPSHPPDPNDGNGRGSMLTVVKIPGVLVCTFGIVATSASIGFISATLEPHLRQFDLSAVKLGVMFVINGGVYALISPFVGFIVDRCSSPKYASVLGSISIIIGFSLVGPATYVPYNTSVPLVVIGLSFHGLGIGLLLVSTFSDALRTSIRNGMEDCVKTYGLISGLWTSTFALGAFVGPTVSGVLYDAIGFRKSVYFIIIWHAINALVFGVYLCLSHRRRYLYKEILSKETLNKKSCEDIFISTNNLEPSVTRNGALNTNLSIPIERGCGMSNLIMAASYGSKGNHWQRLDESNIGLLQETHCDDLSLGVYGSFEIEYEAHRETIA